MQFSPKGGNEMAQVSSDDAKRAKSVGKTRCQACVSLSTEGNKIARCTAAGRYISKNGLREARVSGIINMFYK